MKTKLQVQLYKNNKIHLKLHMVIDSSHGNTLNDVEKDLVLNSTGKYFIANNETAGYDF